MTKAERQNLLKDLILEHEFDTQNELVDYLVSKGLQVTQATVSRDIKELGIIKIKGQKKYKYTLSHKEEEQEKKFSGIVKEVICAQNIIVVKTSVGSASSVCIYIDKIALKGVVGTVAGDDNIFIVAENNVVAESVTQELKELLK